MQLDDLLALGIVLAAAAWLVRHFARRFRSVTRSHETPSSKPVQITFPDQDEHDS
jgi:hypothetical protein